MIVARRMIFVLLSLAGVLSNASNVWAHEPLWGDAAATIGDGLYHSAARLNFRPYFQLRRGGSDVPNPDELQQTLYSQSLEVSRGIGPRVNLILEIPMRRLGLSENGLVSYKADYWELSDLTLLGKWRFDLKRGPGTKRHQSLSLGVHLPTGVTDRRDSTGALLEPHMQPGTGAFGMVLGYSFTKSTLRTAMWASIEYEHAFDQLRFTHGDHLEGSVSYGWWLENPDTLDSWGANWAWGVYGEWSGNDSHLGATDLDSGGYMGGVHTTFIVKKSSHEFKVGVMVPLIRHVNGTQLSPSYELGFAAETFF